MSGWLGSMAARAQASGPWRRVGAEFALLLALSLFMGAVGPYGTSAMPGGRRYIYWLACIVGGGAIGIAIDETAGRRVGGFWRRVAVSSLAMTPAVTLLVVLINAAMTGQPLAPVRPFALLWQVWIISALVMTLRALVWRPVRTQVQTRVVVAPPMPEAEAAFRRRLSARRRAARLIAIEAYDHYLRVHTDIGSELVTARFTEALDELAGAHGYQTHRSWWVAGDAIEAIRWRRGVGVARLAGDVVAPVSRTHAPALKAAGWF
jgi:hypothetical protein